MKNKKGFTLIELLIVVAIIAILAAIAIPNFLAAQVRAKVSRTRTDLRTLATAIESYFVDNNSYPLMGLYSHEGGFVDVWGVHPAVGTIGTNEQFLSRRMGITTPIAYISSEPYDPFYLSPILISGTRGPEQDNMRRYCYSSVDGSIIGTGNPPGVMAWHPPVFGAWRLWGSGPDRDRRDIYIRTSATASALVYDPTNGVVSNGDILRSQRTADGERFRVEGIVH